MTRPRNRFVRNAIREFGAGGDTCESWLPRGAPVKGAPAEECPLPAPPRFMPANVGLDDAVVPTATVSASGGLCPALFGSGLARDVPDTKKVHMEFT